MRPTRLVRVLGVLAGLALSSSSAYAGTYEVVSCAGADGANHAWQSFNEDPASIIVGDSCDSVTGGPEDGLFAADRLPSPPNTPKDRAAGWRLNAPAGLRITRFTTQQYLGQRSAGEWFPYLKTAEGTVLDTCAIPGGEDMCERGEAVYDPFGPVATFATDTSGLEAGVRCNATMGSCGNGVFLHAAWVALYSTRIEITDPTAPSLAAPAGPLWADGYQRGSPSVTLVASDLTGIRRTRLLVDGIERSVRERACDYTYVIPCSNEPGVAHTLNTAALPDGPHELKAVAEDTAENPTSATRSIVTDNTAPSAPLDVSVQHPADGPSTSPGLELSWRNPPGQVAPIAAAHWALCRAAAKSACQTGNRRSNLGGELGRTGSLGPLEAGEWQAHLWLEDAAGNVDPATAVGPLRLSVVTGTPRLKNPRLKVLGLRRRGNRVSVRGSALARNGRVTVSVERRLRGRPHRVRGRATIRGGRWTKHLRLRGRLANVRRTTLVVRFAAQSGYKVQTLRRQVQR